MRQEYDNRGLGNGLREASTVSEPAGAAGDATLAALDELGAALEDLEPGPA